MLTRQNMRNMAEKYEIQELPKQTMRLTVHILQKVLMDQCKVFSKGKSAVCTVNCNNSMAATIYNLEK
jgi:hypothetical protein